MIGIPRGKVVKKPTSLNSVFFLLDNPFLWCYTVATLFDGVFVVTNAKRVSI